MNRRRRRGGCLILIVALLLILGGLIELRRWGGPGPGSANTSIVVAPGSSLYLTANALERAHVIRSAQEFVLLSKVFGGSASIKAGEYRFVAHQSARDVLATLQGGRTLQKMVTIPEGIAAVEVYDRLMQAPDLVGEIQVPVEGSVLPDTYAYVRGDTRQSVLDRMQKAMVDYLARAWQRRKPGIAVNNPRDALILASIVEKETSKASERRMVAAVYSNRLKIGMPLQADPTIIYPITHGKPLGRRILVSEREARNDYNTYQMTGLPKGPIANPRRESIDAVLDPAASGAIYFVADGTGGHVFANTLEQHNANVQKWYAIRRAKGEM